MGTALAKSARKNIALRSVKPLSLSARQCHVPHDRLHRPYLQSRPRRWESAHFVSYEPLHFAGKTTRPENHNLDKVPLHGASGLDDATPSRQLLSQRRDNREAG